MGMMTTSVVVDCAVINPAKRMTDQELFKGVASQNNDLNMHAAVFSPPTTASLLSGSHRVVTAEANPILLRHDQTSVFTTAVSIFSRPRLDESQPKRNLTLDVQMYFRMSYCCLATLSRTETGIL